MTVLLAAAWTAAASAQQSREPDSATADAAPVIALESGISLEGPPATTMVVTLAGLADAKLAAPPNCAPVDPASFAGFLRIGQMESAGTYEFTLSSAAWIDVIQDGRAIAPIGIDRAAQCLAGRHGLPPLHLRRA